MNVVKEVKPVYARLSEDSLLEQCLHGKTQNQNEALNKMIWERAPKETFIGSQGIETAVYDTIANFNIGATASSRVLQYLGIEAGKHTLDGCKKIDLDRIRNAEYKEQESSKKRRKMIRGMKKKKIDKCKEQEGLQYAPGEFAT